VKEFRVLPTNIAARKRDRHVRLTMWSAVLLLLGIAILARYRVNSGGPLDAVLECVAILVVGCTIVGAFYLAGRGGLDRASLDAIWVLTGQEIVCKRSGWTEVRISLSEIKRLYERAGWLVVEGAHPDKKIGIPEHLENFASLREELVKYCALTQPPRRSVVPLVATLASYLCWALVLWTKDVVVALPAGIIGLALLAWSSLTVGKNLSGGSKRAPVRLLIGLSWAAALFLLYFRLFNLNR